MHNSRTFCPYPRCYQLQVNRNVRTSLIDSNPPSYSIVEINIVIMVACTPCLPAFFTRVKTLRSDILSLLRSDIVRGSRSDPSFPTAVGPSPVQAPKEPAVMDGWYGDRTALRDDRYIELRDLKLFTRVEP